MIHLKEIELNPSHSFIGTFLLLISVSTLMQNWISPSLYAPYLFLPFFVFFLLSCHFLLGLWLISFVCLLQSLYTPAALPQILTCLLSFFLFFMLLRRFLFLKSLLVFCTCVFVISLFFPYLFDLTHSMQTGNFKPSPFFPSLFRALSTSLLAAFLSPFLRKYLTLPSSMENRL